MSGNVGLKKVTEELVSGSPEVLGINMNTCRMSEV